MGRKEHCRQWLGINSMNVHYTERSFMTKAQFGLVIYFLVLILWHVLYPAEHGLTGPLVALAFWLGSMFVPGAKE